MESDPMWDDGRMNEPSLLKYNVHTPLQALPAEKLKKIAEVTALPLALMLFNLNGDMNIGMSIRTAVILGCSDVYVVGRKKYDRRPEVGAKNYIKIHREKEISPEFFQENRLMPIFVEQGGEPLENFSYRPYFPGRIPRGWRAVLVVGSESHGLPKSLLDSLDAPVITISQYGVLRSLNVAIAASIVLYEYSKQWRESCVI
jgi:tRNA (guanosine-2'-O-)-methyltransferase/TrmH family RNA methyltransferase